MLAIYKREMRSYFTTPTGYIFAAVFLCASGFLFAFSTLQMKTADVSSYYQFLLYAYIIIIPLLTMRSFAEEKKNGTEQLLLTSPVSLFSMVMAKFLAAFTMFAGTLLVSCTYFFVLGAFATNPNWAKILGCTFGIMLVGMCFIAIGVFVSSLTESLFVAAIGTIGILAGLVVAAVLNSLIDSYLLRVILDWLSIYSRYLNFTRGIFDIASLIYYISICIVFLFLTVRTYEKRRLA
ncbi:MAG: ABC transporter permease subunit [Clostridia bacterium]|nr:ABC transporter permease subunit [Clostridia bacterium]